MSDFEAQLRDLEKLFCDSSLPNAPVLRSHALEILISFSDNPEFLAEIRRHPEILRVVIAETANPALNYKALIFLVNVSADAALCSVLQDLGVVGVLYRTILTAMKKVSESHMQVTQGLLELAEAVGDEPTRVSDHDIKKYAVSTSTVSLDVKDLILDVEAIKLAVMVLVNLAALSQAARKDVVQKGSVYEANHIQLVLDWMANPKTFLLFSQFLNVLLSLSSDEEIQAVLLGPCLSKVFNIFGDRAQAGDTASLAELGKLLRNLSFSQDNSRLAEGIVTHQFAKQSSEILLKHTGDQSAILFGRFFVDVLLSLLTSDKAAQAPDTFRPIYETAELKSALAQLREAESSQTYYQERVEALEHILGSWH